MNQESLNQTLTVGGLKLSQFFLVFWHVVVLLSTIDVGSE